jgi:uncharacterized membrane protein YeaQ/YmgE (transglycosylase-associated protein family)
MNLIIWLVIGGVIGWLASIVMKTNAQQGIVLNVVVGIIGAVLGGWLMGRGTINNADLPPFAARIVRRSRRPARNRQSDTARPAGLSARPTRWARHAACGGGSVTSATSVGISAAVRETRDVGRRALALDVRSRRDSHAAFAPRIAPGIARELP